MNLALQTAVQSMILHSTLRFPAASRSIQVWNFGHWILRFVWNLEFVICHFNSDGSLNNL